VRGLDFINASTIASGGFDSKIKLWIISTGVTTRTINTDSNVYTLQLLSDYFYLAAGLENTNIQIYNINNGILIVTLK
jgi:WD40 repeat protein